MKKRGKKKRRESRLYVNVSFPVPKKKPAPAADASDGRRFRRPCAVLFVVDRPRERERDALLFFHFAGSINSAGSIDFSCW